MKFMMTMKSVRSCQWPQESHLAVSSAPVMLIALLIDPKNFMIVKENKLRLWQSLSLSLLALEGEGFPDLPVVSSRIVLYLTELH